MSLALTVSISPRAATQVLKAAVWWRDNRPAAPDAIEIDLHEALQKLVEQPGIGNLVPKAKRPGTRRLYLARTRYFVYYRVEGSTLRVVSFWHASREHPPAA